MVSKNLRIMWEERDSVFDQDLIFQLELSLSLTKERERRKIVLPKTRNAKIQYSISSELQGKIIE